MVSSAADDGAGASCSGDGGGVQGSSAAAAEVEVSSHPDSLKNTPSNIARLEYVIEQCEGREKYRAKTKSPSDGEDFRWYFCKVPLAEDELAASVPRTEIVGKGEYFRFCMRDSLALEAAFLHKEEELLTYWWREYAECSEGPSGPSGNSTANKQLILRSSKSEEATSTHAVDEERVGVPIKGGLYEVDLERRHCFPVYWNGENRRVLRGHWFARKNGLDQLPIREDVAEQLEYAYRGQVWHRRTFQLSGLFAARVDLQGSTQGLHALFTGEDDTWEAQLGVDNSGFPQVTGQGLNGIKLRRGFSLSGSAKPTQDELRQQKEEEIDDYCSQVPVRHLVFMVHGIGQRLEKANLVDDVGDFRHLTASLAERHLTSYQLVTQRILFIPCQWRRGLKLTGESAVEKCTLDGVRGLRVMLGATVHDILYYTSPIYCQDIINSVSNQLNRLYMKFMMRNPSYDGKVSIYAHSLGSVLSYDILCHQANLSSPLPLDCMYSKCGQVEGSEVDAAYESGESNSFMGTKEKDSNENAGDCVEGDILSTSHYNIVAFVEQDVKQLSLSGASSSSTSSLKEFSGHHQHLSEPHASSTECSDSSQLTDAILSPRGVLNSYPLLCEDGNDLTVDINVGVPASDHSGDTLTCDMLENVEDKDKIIFNMREEVNFLKAKIAELEARNNSSAFLKRDGEVGHNCQQGVVERCPSKENAMDHHHPRKSHTPYITYTKLKFEVDTFFAVGSPLAVFLALRNIRIGIGKGQEYRQDEKITEEMPACHQMFNIFHPFDPVAYRVEPLVCKEYISKRPVIIPYHKGGKRLHIGFQEFTEDLALRSKEFVNQLNFVKVKMVSVFLKNKDKLQDATENAQSVDERTYGSLMMQRLTGSEDGRIDYVLQNKTFQHPYISAIGSHTNYWRDPDTALFILNHLYRDIPEKPDSPDFVGGLKNVEKKIGLIYQTDPMDEDLPLTFSDNSLIRAFSRKARRSMKKS